MHCYILFTTEEETKLFPRGEVKNAYHIKQFLDGTDL